MRTSRFTAADRRAMAKEYKTGSTIRDLATAFECSTPTVIRLLEEEGTKMRKRGRRKGVKIPRKPGHKKPGPKPKGSKSEKRKQKRRFDKALKISKKAKYHGLPSNKQLKKAARGAKVLQGKAIKVKVKLRSKPAKKSKARRKKPARKA